MHPSDLVSVANVRTMEDIESSESFIEFQQSIVEQGVLEPITYYVDNGRNIILHGHRRWLAAKLCDLPDVPTHRAKRPKDDSRRIIQQLVTGVQRRDLNHLDVANGLLSLVGVYSQKALAAQFGKSEAWVSQHLGLLNLIPPLQDRVRSGDLAYRAGYEARSITAGDYSKWKSAIDAAKTVRAIQQVRRGIQAAKEIDNPQPIQTTLVEAPDEDIIEETPDEELLQCMRLLEMARDNIRAARQIANEHQLSITSNLKDLKGELQ